MSINFLLSRAFYRGCWSFYENEIPKMELVIGMTAVSAEQWKSWLHFSPAFLSLNPSIGSNQVTALEPILSRNSMAGPRVTGNQGKLRVAYPYMYDFSKGSTNVAPQLAMLYKLFGRWVSCTNFLASQHQRSNQDA